MTSPAPILDPMTILLQTVISRLPGWLQDVIRGYEPILSRMTEDQVWSIIESLRAGSQLAAYAAIQGAMTDQELLVEKSRLRGLTERMASDAQAVRQLTRAIIAAALYQVLNRAITMV